MGPPITSLSTSHVSVLMHTFGMAKMIESSSWLFGATVTGKPVDGDINVERGEGGDGDRS